jgi:hypothetical protein
MNEILQNTIVALIVLVAGAYVARSAWGVLVRKRAPGCSSCASCGANSAPEPRTLVTLDAHAIESHGFDAHTLGQRSPEHHS